MECCNILRKVVDGIFGGSSPAAVSAPPIVGVRHNIEIENTTEPQGDHQQPVFVDDSSVVNCQTVVDQASSNFLFAKAKPRQESSVTMERVEVVREKLRTATVLVDTLPEAPAEVVEIEPDGTANAGTGKQVGKKKRSRNRKQDSKTGPQDNAADARTDGERTGTVVPVSQSSLKWRDNGQSSALQAELTRLHPIVDFSSEVSKTQTS